MDNGSVPSAQTIDHGSGTKRHKPNWKKFHNPLVPVAETARSHAKVDIPDYIAQMREEREKLMKRNSNYDPFFIGPYSPNSQMSRDEHIRKVDVLSIQT